VIRSVLSDFPWPSVPGMIEPPKWVGDGFLTNGKKQGSLICYNQTDSNWSEHLTELHEQEAGNGQHSIDIASRHLALSSFRKLANNDEALLLEVGCSSGYLLQDFQKYFPNLNIIGSDYLAEPLKKLSIHCPKIPLLQFDLQNCPLPDDSVDGVVALNVLEHIEKDELALKHLYRILKPGGIMHIEVPAGQNLYDIYDEYLLHHRRYSLMGIEDKVKVAGFKILNSTHLGFSIYPAFWAVKKMNRRFLSNTEEQKQKVVTKQIRQTKNNLLMKLALEIEIKLGTFVRFPFGIRCILSCRK
jgi:ubiquinone/menaquinone biosynthesis C-methylase UbiE